jgi:hypothetical protein
MKKLLFLLILGAAACSTPKSENASTTPNQLTEEQKAAGWKLLFDGQTMNGWRSFKNKENNTWEVLDVIRLQDCSGRKQRTDLSRDRRI